MIYKNIVIHHADKNSSGIKYFAYVKGGRVMADTLRGIKRLIAETKTKKKRSHKMSNYENIKEIEYHPVYRQVLNDSFGGVMYDVANRGKYDSQYIINLWDNMSDSAKESAGGIMKGAIGFLKGE